MMEVKKIWSSTLGWDKGSYIEIEHQDGRLQRINLRRDKKRFNEGALGHQYYFLKEGKRIYADEVRQNG